MHYTLSSSEHSLNVLRKAEAASVLTLFQVGLYYIQVDVIVHQTHVEFVCACGRPAQSTSKRMVNQLLHNLLAYLLGMVPGGG